MLLQDRWDERTSTARAQQHIARRQHPARGKGEPVRPELADDGAHLVALMPYSDTRPAHGVPCGQVPLPGVAAHQVAGNEVVPVDGPASAGQIPQEV